MPSSGSVAVSFQHQVFTYKDFVRVKFSWISLPFWFSFLGERAVVELMQQFFFSCYLSGNENT